MKLRFYTLDGSVWRRLPTSHLDRDTAHVYPQFAGTRQRTLQATYTLEGKRVTYLDLRGHTLPFDATGRIDHMTSMREFKNATAGPRASELLARLRVESDPVVSLADARAVKEGEQKREAALAAHRAAHHWEPGEADVAMVSDDVTGRKKLPLLKPGEPLCRQREGR